MGTLPKVDLAGAERHELERVLADLGSPPFHARQIFGWIHKRGVTDVSLMTDLGHQLRARLTGATTVTTPEVARIDRSSDGTIKLLLRLADGKHIESVCIPEHPVDPTGLPGAERLTFCLSTQVGCAMRCAFCLTGRMGIDRNLTAGEIVGQVRVLTRELGPLARRFTIVLMGMGEPLHNYDETMKALRILADPLGLAVSPKRVTLSTVGVLPALERLANEPLMPNLAISLHSTTEAQRDLLVPINRKYGIEELIEACRRFPLRRRERVTFEYVMLKDVNDTPDDARRLARLMSGLQAKVNLLPLNEAAGIPFERPSDAAVSRFAGMLAERGVSVSVRKSRGRDIRAACGQLITESRAAAPGRRLALAMSAAEG